MPSCLPFGAYINRLRKLPRPFVSRTETKITTKYTYYKMTFNSRELIEIDTINMVEKVNGTDRLEQRRKNIGLV